MNTYKDGRTDSKSPSCKFQPQKKTQTEQDCNDIIIPRNGRLSGNIILIGLWDSNCYFKSMKK